VAGSVPLPLRCSCTPVVTVRVSVKLDAVVGVNSIVKLQLAPAPKLPLRSDEQSPDPPVITLNGVGLAAKVKADGKVYGWFPMFEICG
jgi:hypothetical protein